MVVQKGKYMIVQKGKYEITISGIDDLILEELFDRWKSQNGVAILGKQYQIDAIHLFSEYVRRHLISMYDLNDVEVKGD